MPSKAARRQKWNNVGENKVVLHMFPRNKTRPSGSPFVIKFETFLRMANIEYENDFEEPMGSKGKSPWMTFNGEEMADSQFCIEYLSEKLDKDLNKNLDDYQKAAARALRIMLEEHFYWCLEMLIIHQKGKYYKSVLPPLPVPGFLQGFMFNMMLKNQAKNAHAQGIGRHSKEEIEKLGIADLRSLDQFLGSKSFLMGNEPTEVDACAFGFLCFVYACDPDDDIALKKAGEEEFPRLQEYFERMKEKYWPDWEEIKWKPEEKPAKKSKEEKEEKEEEKKEEEAEGTKEEKKDEDKKEGE